MIVKTLERHVEDEQGQEISRSRRPVPARAVQDGDERRVQLIAAAEQVFLEKGYHAARMDDIAKTAAMSKKTIYQIFASKEELFEALVDDRILPAMPSRYDPTKVPEEMLAEVLLDFVKWKLLPSRIALLRLIMGEYSRSPELGRIVERQGRQRAQPLLERCLAALEATGGYEIGEPREAAKMLVGMAIGNIHAEMLLGFSHTVTQAAIRRRVERSVRIFLRGTRIGSAPCVP